MHTENVANILDEIQFGAFLAVLLSNIIQYHTAETNVSHQQNNENVDSIFLNPKTYFSLSLDAMMIIILVFRCDCPSNSTVTKRISRQ